jgi:uncharacterized protein YecE (DUF72 family)
MVKNWNKRVQEHFRFAVVPKVITHDNIKRYRKGNRTFWDMEPLYDKILYFGFSSPSLQIAEGLIGLRI